MPGGTLIGQQYIHESTLTDVIYAIADRYVTEDVIPCLGDNGIDLPTYRDVVLKRFTNPYIQTPTSASPPTASRKFRR